MTAQLAVVVALLCLAAANIYVRATWSEAEDGVLWSATAGRHRRAGNRRSFAGVDSAAAAGDILEAIDGKPVDAPATRSPRRCIADPPGSRSPTRFFGTRHGTPDRHSRADRFRRRGLYYVLASVGIFSLLVGSGVRFRRPGQSGDAAFLLVDVAFFGMLAFSFSGRLDTLDWVIYWADVDLDAAAAAAHRPFRARISRTARQLGAQRRRSDRRCPLLYLPALLLGGRTRRRAAPRAAAGRPSSRTSSRCVERGELIGLGHRL